MGQGKDKIARSLLELQPTAIVEFYRIFPDVINKPTLSIDIHGGSIFKQPITWQGVKYAPVPIEAEGFELTANGQLPRPKVRLANKDFLITSLLQNHSDFKNAEIVRKRTFIKYLDDVNFDAGNPFGQADSTAEISEETYVVGQKTQENKAIVELELTSPLDLENYEVNHRRILGKYCYWTYRGRGCNYSGPPINRENGEGFRVAGTGALVVPDISNFNHDDPRFEWNSNRGYVESDIAYVENPRVVVGLSGPASDGNQQTIGLKTWYVCVSGNTGQRPEDNPSYWQKDGCNKKLSSCKLRFNEDTSIPYQETVTVTSTEDKIRISGVDNQLPIVNSNNATQEAFFDLVGTNSTRQSAILISNDSDLTGFYTNADGSSADFTIALFVDINGNNSTHRAGLLDTRTGWADHGYANDRSDMPSATGAEDRGPDNTAEPIRGKFTWFTDSNSSSFGKNSVSVNLPIKGASRLPGWPLGNETIRDSNNNTRSLLGFGIRRSNTNRNLLVLTVNGNEKVVKTYNLQSSGQTVAPATILDLTSSFGPDADFDWRTNCFSLGTNMNHSRRKSDNRSTHYGKNPFKQKNAIWGSATADYIGCAIWKRELDEDEIGILIENVKETTTDAAGNVVNGSEFSTFRDYDLAPSNLTGVESQLVAWWEDVTIQNGTSNLTNTNPAGSVVQGTVTDPVVFLDSHGGRGHDLGISDGVTAQNHKPKNLTGLHDLVAMETNFGRSVVVNRAKTDRHFCLPFGGFPGTDGFTYQA